MDKLYEDPRYFGVFIKKLRNKYGWSRSSLAKKLGFSSESSVMNFETGLTNMRWKYVSRFCSLTPNKLTVPVLFAMFEASSLVPPCRCICHHDMANTIPKMYDDEGRCRICRHSDSDCNIMNGLWFEQGEENFYDQLMEESGEPE